MSYVEHYRSTYSVTASGAGATQTFNTSFVANGLLESVVITNATASGISTGANVLITGAISGQTYLNVTSTGSTNSVVAHYPRAVARSNTDALYSWATGAAAVVGVPVLMPVAEAFKIHTTSGATAAGASNGGARFTLDFYLSR